MDIVFMGTPDFAVPSLEALYASGYNVTAVFTQPDKRQGRGYRLTPPPVKECACRNGTVVYQPNSLKNGDEAEKTLDYLKKLAPDIIVVVAYGKILPKELLEIPKIGCINVHASLLPKYRGAGPIQWSVLNGEKVTGVTTMFMAEGLDTGDMLLKEEITINENETASELHDRLSIVGARVLLKTLSELEKGGLKAQKQDDCLSCYAPMLSKELCPVDFSKTSREVHNQIRGLSDWPCATAVLNGKKIKLFKSEIINEEKYNSIFGEIVDEKSFVVSCKKGFVRIIELQAEGGKRMRSVDYLRGNPVKKGTVLTKCD
ncbi:MAG: methionyl-tRNA formyltransferase [Oscillospiraceae bacterium]|jgi:methionyl-tRNA formyltransferase